LNVASFCSPLPGSATNTGPEFEVVLPVAVTKGSLASIQSGRSLKSLVTGANLAIAGMERSWFLLPVLCQRADDLMTRKRRVV
jgi:hypothetical protein